MGRDMILTSSRKRQLAWNTFHSKLEEWSLEVDGLPARKKQVFDMLYFDDRENPQLRLIQDRHEDHFTVETKIDGNVFIEKAYQVVFKKRSDCAGYNAKLVEEANTKTILNDYTKKGLKVIKGEITTERLAEILNQFAYIVYVNHENIEKQADKLYKLL